MMGPWLTGIISDLSGINTRFLMIHFLPLHVSLRGRSRRERKSWLSLALSSSFLSQIPCPLSQISFMILEFQSSFRGRGNTISCRFCWWRNWCYLPLFSPSSGLDLIEGKNKGMHSVVFGSLWTTLEIGLIYNNMYSQDTTWVQEFRTTKQTNKHQPNNNNKSPTWGRMKTSIYWLYFQMSIKMEGIKPR